MYDGHKYMLKTATSGKAFNSSSASSGLEFHVNTPYAYRWKGAPYVATFRVLGGKKTPTYSCISRKTYTSAIDFFMCPYFTTN